MLDMSKDKRDTKSKTPYEFHSGERNKKEGKTPAPSKLKCGKLGIDCLIKN